MLLVVAAVSGVVIGFSVNRSFYSVRNVSIEEVVSNPQSFDGVHVRLYGYVVNTSVYMFGPKYVLRDFDNRVQIALAEKSGPQEVGLDPYVSFVFDGRNYTQIRRIWLYIVGYVRYIGLVVDSPSFCLDVEMIEPSLADLESIVIEFLKTTDVANGSILSMEILEVYDHELGGKIAVVNYTTANAVHPHFMCEAIEHHTAVITLSKKKQVVSAFCVWGSFHDCKIWDLPNHRWIQKAY